MEKYDKSGNLKNKAIWNAIMITTLSQLNTSEFHVCFMIVAYETPATCSNFSQGFLIVFSAWIDVGPVNPPGVPCRSVPSANLLMFFPLRVKTPRDDSEIHTAVKHPAF